MKKQKKNIEPQQNFTGSYKKCEGSGLTPKFTKYQKVRQKLSEQQNMKFIN